MGRQMFVFLLVSDNAGHSILGPGPLSGHLQGGGFWVEARPVVGLFKCSWLYLGASLIGS
jgi:hypothetical protein